MQTGATIAENKEEGDKLKKAKLVIIGNGFDLAHGYKTGYNHFICDLLYQEVQRAHALVKDCINDTGNITRRENFQTHLNFRRNYEITNEVAEEFIDEIYFDCLGRNGQEDTENALYKLDEIFRKITIDLNNLKNENDYFINSWLSEINLRCQECSYLNGKINLSPYLNTLINDIHIQGWVDIEDAYYSVLKKIYIEGSKKPSSKRYQITETKKINTTADSTC